MEFSFPGFLFGALALLLCYGLVRRFLKNRSLRSGSAQGEGKKPEPAFLCVDMVDSSSMQLGEDPDIVDRDFRQYRAMVERAAHKHGCLKSEWVAEEAMLCFASARDAFSAVREVFFCLRDFNRQVKLLRCDFRMRMGLHTEQDAARRVQQQAEEGSLYVAQPLIPSLPGLSGLSPAHTTVDGLEMFVWRSQPMRRNLGA